MRKTGEIMGLHRLGVGALTLVLSLTATGSALLAGEYSRALALREQGRYAEAARELRGGSEMRERMLLARIYLDQNRLREASRIFRDLCPRMGNADCWNAYGVTYMSLGGYPQAEKNFLKALKLKKTPRYYSNLALAYFYQRRPVDARQAHEQAMALAPKNPIPKINYAVFLTRSKDYQRALVMLKAVAVQNPDLYFVRLHLGYVYFRMKKYRQAIAEYNKGIARNDRSFELYYYRAYALYKINDLGGAMRDLNRCDKIQPLNARTGPLKGLIQRRQRGHSPGRSPFQRRDPYRYRR